MILHRFDPHFDPATHNAYVKRRALVEEKIETDYLLERERVNSIK